MNIRPQTITERQAPYVGHDSRRLRRTGSYRMDLHPAGERKPVRGGKRKNARQPPKRAIGLDSHRVPIFKSFRDALVLPPAEMRAVRTLLRIGGCLDHHHLAPAIHG